jgi:hypothetical protein
MSSQTDTLDFLIVADLLSSDAKTRPSLRTKPVGNVHHHAHVMFDQDHGQSESQIEVLYETRAHFGLRATHACGRLIEEQDLGLCGQGDPDFQVTPFTVREDRGKSISLFRQSHLLKYPCRLPIDPFKGGGRFPEIKGGLP